MAGGAGAGVGTMMTAGVGAGPGLGQVGSLPGVFSLLQQVFRSAARRVETRERLRAAGVALQTSVPARLKLRASPCWHVGSQAAAAAGACRCLWSLPTWADADEGAACRGRAGGIGHGRSWALVHAALLAGRAAAATSSARAHEQDASSDSPLG